MRSRNVSVVEMAPENAIDPKTPFTRVPDVLMVPVPVTAPRLVPNASVIAPVVESQVPLAVPAVTVAMVDPHMPSQPVPSWKSDEPNPLAVYDKMSVTLKVAACDADERPRLSATAPINEVNFTYDIPNL